MNGTTYRCRWIIPPGQEPIHDGEFWIDDAGVLRSVGRRNATGHVSAQSHRVVDLGDVAVTSPLINSHTHLEFSDLNRPVGRRGIAFTDWIAEVIQTRLSGDRNPHHAIHMGLQQSRDFGVGTIVDITTPPPCDEMTVDAAESVTIERLDDVHRIRLAEVIGLDDSRAAERLSAGIEASQSSATDGLSPHAPYSLDPAVFDQAVRWCDAHRRPIAMHVAETMAERQFVEFGDGPMAKAFAALGIDAAANYPFRSDAIETICKTLASRRTPSPTLVVHGNYLSHHEMDALSKSDALSVVYCPRTHDFFDHSNYPLDALRKRGLRVVLGTDSRASNPDLNLWSDVRFASQRHPEISPLNWLSMVTDFAAKAIAIQSGLTEGRPARWVTFDTPRSTTVAALQTELMVADHPRFYNASPY